MVIPSDISITTQAKLFFEQLCSGEITPEMYYNKKTYARSKGQIKKVLDLSVAWELYKYVKDNDEK